jgi:hypothetical protein
MLRPAVRNSKIECDTMSKVFIATELLVLNRKIMGALATSLATALLSLGSLVGFSTTDAFACACGCSVFDVSGLDMMPQEQDHGGRIFFEYWSQDQTQNYVGASNAYFAKTGQQFR